MDGLRDVPEGAEGSVDARAACATRLCHTACCQGSATRRDCGLPSAPFEPGCGHFLDDGTLAHPQVRKSTDDEYFDNSWLQAALAQIQTWRLRKRRTIASRKSAKTGKFAAATRLLPMLQEHPLFVPGELVPAVAPAAAPPPKVPPVSALPPSTLRPLLVAPPLPIDPPVATEPP